jgi:bifunctional non-homologous end joining protein LigD
VLKGSGLLLSDASPGSAAQVLKAVSQLGLEGVIAKRKDSRYESGERSGAWVKLKQAAGVRRWRGSTRIQWRRCAARRCLRRTEADVRWEGSCGFHAAYEARSVREVEALHTNECPFANLPSANLGRWGSGVTAEDMKEMQWVKPQLVLQIRFVEWTAEENLRHAALLGIRADKKARAVRRET